MGIGFEIVWRIATISGGVADCKPWQENKGSTVTFECPQE